MINKVNKCKIKKFLNMKKANQIYKILNINNKQKKNKIMKRIYYKIINQKKTIQYKKSEYFRNLTNKYKKHWKNTKKECSLN